MSFDNSDKFEEFLTNPYINEYLNSSDKTIRFAVTAISAYCELLKNCGTDNEKAAELTNGILDACCKLMRPTEMAAVLSPKKNNLTTVMSDKFISDFIEKCSNSIGDNCTINKGEVCSMPFETDVNLLTYLLLIFIRKAASSAKTPTAITISALQSNERLDIIVDSNADFSQASDDPYDFTEFYDKNYKLIYDVIAKKLDTDVKVDINRVTVSIALNDKKGLAFASNSEPVEYGYFSPFNIMLRDIGDNDISEF